MSTSDTPRTDAEAGYEVYDHMGQPYFADFVSSDFARQLERELNEANRALHKCLAATGDDAGDIDDFRALVDREKITVEEVENMAAELRSERAKVAKLREAARSVGFGRRRTQATRSNVGKRAYQRIPAFVHRN